MKKLIGLVMTVVMLFVMQGALAEGEQLAPLYATVGEVLEDSAETVSSQAVFRGNTMPWSRRKTENTIAA